MTVEWRTGDTQTGILDNLPKSTGGDAATAGVKNQIQNPPEHLAFT